MTKLATIKGEKAEMILTALKLGKTPYFVKTDNGVDVVTEATEADLRAAQIWESLGI